MARYRVSLRAGFAATLALASIYAFAQNYEYTKYEYMIPMRDGAKLYTSVYVPKTGPANGPILLQRTPYSAGPYGPEAQKRGHGGSEQMKKAGYIFAYQDVRGKYMSEGDFVNVRPQLLPGFTQTKFEPGKADIDESTDTYDTVDYLVKNVPKNNGRVGLWGISYPGGYAALGALAGHPALKAVSPQAPTTDWFLGDDFHHNGAFMMQDYISFFSGFGGVRPTPGPTNPRAASFSIGDDAYKFFLELGGMANVDPKIFKGNMPYWQDAIRHDTYDEFWQARAIQSRLKDVKCAMLWVGGFFDAEDCWGPQAAYKSAEVMSPKQDNFMILGPWYHGMWAGGNGTTFHVHDWGSNTSQYFQEEIEFKFFDAYLRGNGKPGIPEVTVFDSGSKQWKTFEEWPPKAAKPVSLYFQQDGSLKWSPNRAQDALTYLDDPANPVPYQGGKLTRRTREYMLDDQRFCLDRKDVLTFKTDVLNEDVTLAGELEAEIFAKVSGTDTDFIVKLIDAFPDNEAKNPGFHMLVRGEVMRAKFRDSFSNPKPLNPTMVERVPFRLPDTFHTFKKGHRIMIQVQGSWFPLVDRNPHKFMNIFTAKDEDYVSANVSVFTGGQFASRVKVSGRL
ncbi:MAG: CocE/NonD family hydrolase [Armatimonadetes bacterium]|nr:CocE/NonD family hydrolase [Armatimonadota bacterium]